MRVLEGADLRELRETLLNVNTLFLRLGLLVLQFVFLVVESMEYVVSVFMFGMFGMFVRFVLSVGVVLSIVSIVSIAY